MLGGELPLRYIVLREHPKSCMSMGPDPAPILQSKRDQHMTTTMADRHLVGGVLNILELPVFHMFGRKSRDGRHLRQNRVPLDRCHNPIDDEMTSTLRKVQHQKVSRACAVVRSHAPSLLNN